MEWNVQQRAALAAVAKWYADPKSPQVFRLFGYAGTGKTTLAREFGKGILGRVLYGAFTGKAALVLRQKGAHGAETIHRLIYTPKDKSSMNLRELKDAYEALLLKKGIPADEVQRHERKCRLLAHKIKQEEDLLKQPAFVLNEESEVQYAKLVVIDEVSMVGTDMAHDLLSFGTKVLVLGDPAQLPPVGTEGYFTNADPDVLLTEVHRQAANSPIITLATGVREGHGLPLGIYGDSSVSPKGTHDIHAIAQHDQVLCGRNAMRHTLNRRIREDVLGRTDALPVVGDKLVCLRNNHEAGLLNGSLWKVRERMAADEEDMCLALEGEDGRIVETVAHTALFLGRELSYWDRRRADEFDYGYALTVHKAQGSQWGSVFVVDESACFRKDGRRWLYTALTRASERVTVVR
jgi:exodeoxyribonuclease-5